MRIPRRQERVQHISSIATRLLRHLIKNSAYLPYQASQSPREGYDNHEQTYHDIESTPLLRPGVKALDISRDEVIGLIPLLDLSRPRTGRHDGRFR
jgi:hypothetical protein